MITHHGVSGTEVDGVFFTETSKIESAQELGEVTVTINGQNKDLRNVKRELARRVVSMGGNALVGFTYGQRGNPWWKSLVGSMDAEHWYGAGRAVLLRK